MQSFLQYRRTGREVKRRFSKPVANHTSRKTGNLLQASSNRTSSDGSRSTLVSDLQRIDALDTQRLNTKDIEAGPPEDGINLRKRTTREGEGLEVMEVAWAGEHDPTNPKNWSNAKRISATLLVSYITFACLMASSIDAAIVPQAAKEFGVSYVVESLSIAMYLIGSGVGALVTGPFSETFGRNPVYLGTMFFLMIFIMASGLSPNIGAQLTFRFFVGFFACAPLTVAGGTIADLWNSVEKVYAFPLFAIPGFGGAMLGPAIGSYVYTLSTWRWTEWISLIVAGMMTSLAFLFLPETHAGVLLSWRAKHLRTFSGDDRYQSASEIVSMTFSHRMRIALTRPWLLALEPIVVVITLYLTVIWAILFTFLDGYTYIFMKPYNLSQGQSNVIFVAMYVGVLLAGFLVPIVYFWTKNDAKQRNVEKGGQISGPVTVRPETRLWYAMLGGAWAIPISLFWLGWTNFPSISIWSPICATTLFGFGLINVFMTSYMYVIDAYQVNAASALTFATVIRFLVSGGLTVAGIPFYENVGSHWTLTILGVIATMLMPAPYLLYRWGPTIRKKSKYSVYND